MQLLASEENELPPEVSCESLGPGLVSQDGGRQGSVPSISPAATNSDHSSPGFGHPSDEAGHQF